MRRSSAFLIYLKERRRKGKLLGTGTATVCSGSTIITDRSSVHQGPSTPSSVRCHRKYMRQHDIDGIAIDAGFFVNCIIAVCFS